MEATAKNFKGDALEIKMDASASSATAFVGAALDEFHAGGEDCDAFLLSLYDSGRMPYSQRISRDVFVSFFREAVKRFPFMGNFDSYIFILREVFGEESGILFDVPAAGKLSIEVSAISALVFDAVVREFDTSGNAYEFSNLITSGGDRIVFRGVSGIQTETDLRLLFAEMMPGGIFPIIDLSFFSKSFFIAEDDSGISKVVDHLGNEIVFIETGE